MNIITAVSSNWGIGKDNKLLFHIPEDMKFFKNMTTGKIVVMGRKTLESFPGKRPLPNRTNIVLSRNLSYSPEGVITVHSLEELFKELKKYNSDDIFICGGEEIYRLLLPYCDKAYLTSVLAAADADSFFPELTTVSGWELFERSEVLEDNGYQFTFDIYKKTKTL